MLEKVDLQARCVILYTQQTLKNAINKINIMKITKTNKITSEELVANSTVSFNYIKYIKVVDEIDMNQKKSYIFKGAYVKEKILADGVYLVVAKGNFNGNKTDSAVIEIKDSKTRVLAERNADFGGADFLKLALETEKNFA